MLFTPLILALVCAAVPAFGQQDSAATLQTLQGTWSSGPGVVITGPTYANPANKTFGYPKTTGVCYSFTADGFFESFRYRYNSNGTAPQCITGVLVWIHGTVTVETNGSLVLNPLADGYQQIQDPCAAVSNTIEDYSDTELYQGWQMFQDPTLGQQLLLFQFDGSPVAPLRPVANGPNMLPTQLLRNDSAQATATAGLTTQNALAMNNGRRRWSVSGTMGALTVVFGVGLGSLLL